MFLIPTSMFQGFQEDTFAHDSLGYILSLLVALDSHGFSLMTSLVINRSRVKDLWIFTGLVDAAAALEYSSLSLPSEPRSEPKLQSPQRGDTSYNPPPSPLHLENGHVNGSARFATLGGKASSEPPLSPSNALRKPAPRAQLPVSVASLIEEDRHAVAGLPPARRSNENARATFQSSTGSAVNMTGVGAGVRHTLADHTAPLPASQSLPSPAVFYQTSAPEHDDYFPDYAGLGETPAPQVNVDRVAGSPPLSQGHLSNPHRSFLATKDSTTPPLLGPGVFRDSAFSTGSLITSEIPIAWTGQLNDPSSQSDPVIPTPVLPGGWTSPTDEMVPTQSSSEPANGNGDLAFRPRPQDLTPDRQEVHAAIGFAVTQSAAARQSEAVVLDQVPHEALAPVPPSSKPLVPPRPSPSDKTDTATTPQSGEGWVLVNVTGQPGSASTPSLAQPSPTKSKFFTRTPADSRALQPSPGVSPHHAEPSTTSLTAAAHQILEGRAHSPFAGDASSGGGGLPQRERSETQAMHTQAHTKAKSVTVVEPTSLPGKEPPASPLRRIFSGSSRRGKGGVGKSRSFEQEEKDQVARRLRLESTASEAQSRFGLRERWRRRGVSEVTKTDRRISID
jgi:hypothetical protein